MGGVSDLEYMSNRSELNENRIFSIQRVFHNEDLVNGKVKPFHNILDKSYRVAQSALSNNERVIQPIFTKTGHGFSQLNRLCISEIVLDRSGNEQATNVVKRSGFCLIVLSKVNPWKDLIMLGRLSPSNTIFYTNLFYNFYFTALIFYYYLAIKLIEKA